MKKQTNTSLKLTVLGSALAIVGWIASPVLRTAQAEENLGEKVQAQARETKTGTKKLVRKAKKKARDATGNQSLKKDVQDAARNVGDEADDAAHKIKNKID